MWRWADNVVAVFFFHYVDWCEAGDLTSNDNRSVNRGKKTSVRRLLHAFADIGQESEYCALGAFVVHKYTIYALWLLSITLLLLFCIFHLINDARIKNTVYFVLFLLFITYSTGNNVASSCIISLSFSVSFFSFLFFSFFIVFVCTEQKQTHYCWVYLNVRMNETKKYIIELILCDFLSFIVR